MRKLSLGHLWCTTDKLLEVAYDYNILPPSFMFLNVLKFATSQEMASNFPQATESVVIDEKTYFGVPFTHLSGFAESPRFRLDLLCGNFVDLAIHHIESNSFETFHASSNHCLFMRKLTLGHLWCTTERLLEIACDSNILPLYFLSLSFWKFQKSNKMAWNFAQMTESVLVDEQKLVWSSFHTSLWFCRLSKISSI